MQPIKSSDVSVLFSVGLVHILLIKINFNDWINSWYCSLFCINTSAHSEQTHFNHWRMKKKKKKMEANCIKNERWKYHHYYSLLFDFKCRTWRSIAAVLHVWAPIYTITTSIHVTSRQPKHTTSSDLPVHSSTTFKLYWTRFRDLKHAEIINNPSQRTTCVFVLVT